ncbi:MAG: flavodoxin domain-containing protein [Candidatus Bathyarchaeota archaeon]|nr:flavodoxin domain-containing protein [Candidatus Bathyarchaeota archaeon]
MKKLLILYYSRSGNTERMAQAIAAGVQSYPEVEVDLNYHIDASELKNYDAILIGAPTYHHDIPLDFKVLFEEAASLRINLKGKIGSAFGSFGWSGEAPKLILEIMKNKFEMEVPEAPLLAKYTPDQNVLNSCKEFGKRISENLKNQG